jgi:integrase
VDPEVAGSKPVIHPSNSTYAASRAAFRGQPPSSIVALIHRATVREAFMATVFFHRKRKSYYTRAYIPRKIRRLVHNRLELWRSLDTTDADVAALRSSQWDTRLHRLFLTLKRDGQRMTQAQIDALVEHWLNSSLEDADDFRATEGPFSDADRDTKCMILHEQLEDAAGALLSCDYRKVEREADELLKAAGLPALDHQGAEFGKLCRKLLEAKIEYARIQAEIWDSGESQTQRARQVATRVTAPPVVPAAATPATPPPPAARSGPLFSVVVDKYFADNPRPDRTAKPMRAEFARFTKTLGEDRAIERITKDDVRRYKESLKHERKSSPATVSKHLSALSVVFKWAEANGYVPDNTSPIKGLQPSKKAVRASLKQRRPFTSEELLQVFGSLKFKAQKDSQPERYWVPLICVFQLCRREEAAQLAVADIQTEDGIAFMQIKADESLKQGLKNESSQRRMPIHSSLIKLGFLDYVARIKQAKHVMVFPGLTKGNNGYGDPLGKWFGRLIRKCGVTDSRVVLHSSRHGISELHNAGCPHHVAEILTGHAATTIHDRVYGHRELTKLSVLRDGLEKLQYEEVMKALT